MTLSSARLLPGALVLLCAAAWGCGDGPAPSPPPESKVPSAETVAERNRADAERRDRHAQQRLPFWRDVELSESLGLSGEQISVMEQRRQAQLEKRRRERVAATETRGLLSAALEAGDWEKARELGSELQTVSAGQLEADLELKIAILSSLNEDQRRQLARESPGALRRSWLLPGREPRGPKRNPLLDPP
ncbi:MAG: hypothetical protein AAF725_12465 [Acidobacteriota bacterium]